ncbi:CAP domain-containing protein, partial [Weissella kandleri]|uniref:CAP domain-containing protein n=1 Tax=Weissella kandleri TaxID=1616 RepID=UPI00191BD7A5
PASDTSTTEAPATNNNGGVDGTNIADLQYNVNADAEGDGFMSVSEYNNWVNNGRPEVAAPASDTSTTEAPATNNNVAVDGTNIADLQYNVNADANGDGFMSVDEYNNWVNNGRPAAAAPVENAPAANNNQASNNSAGNSTATAGSYSDAMNAMNSLRASYGLAPVSYDGGLAATASMRAAMLAGGLDSAHFSQTYGYEVVAIQFGSGAGVISAWYNETNMIGAPGHRNWLLNPSIRHVGFGYDANTATFVGEAS